MTTRREFLEQSAASTMGLSLSLRGLATNARQPVRVRPAFVDVRRPPDEVTAETASSVLRLAPAGAGLWRNGAVTVNTFGAAEALRVELTAPGVAVKRVHLYWRGAMSDMRAFLGDAWERGYGDLEWRGFVPDRAMPWYFVTSDGERTHGYGVRTGAKAFCFWRAGPDGISLWADVRSGAAGVELGDRRLAVCDVVCREGTTHETAFAALHAFCRQMCANPKLPTQPVFGSNDWYYAYGKNSAATVLSDAQRIVELSPPGGNRPFVVIDDGWQPGRGRDKAGAGTWDRGNEKFPDIAALAADVKRAGARPGIWLRPLQASADAPESWRLPRDRSYLDPTIPDVRHKVAEDIARIRAWGFDLVKHDYSTFDVFGRWGSQMGTALTKDGWTFGSGATQTTAEVIDELYGTIRAAAGDALIIGCNTVSHLSAGHFEISRVGDDTSGTEWARTRKMGVNSLAFRGAQHGAFYAVDADCVGVTNAVPWQYNRQWLDLLARSGTTLFVSLAPDALGADERRDLRAALALAAVPQPLGEPLDWQGTVWPAQWKLMHAEHTYDWGPVENS